MMGVHTETSSWKKHKRISCMHKYMTSGENNNSNDFTQGV